MNPENQNPAPVDNAVGVNAAVQHVITLVDELLVVIEDENRILARGMPASLSKSINRKNELADAFETMVKLVADRQLCLHMSDEALRQHLVVRVRALRVVMTENTDRLRAAIDATRRRIEAVMRAIKEEMSRPPGYGPNGRLQESRAPQSFRCNGVNA